MSLCNVGTHCIVGVQCWDIMYRSISAVYIYICVAVCFQCPCIFGGIQLTKTLSGDIGIIIMYM